MYVDLASKEEEEEEEEEEDTNFGFNIKASQQKENKLREEWKITRFINIAD